VSAQHAAPIPSDDEDLRAIGSRIEQLLEELTVVAPPGVHRRVEELVGLVTDLHGAGLARVLTIAADEPTVLRRVLADDLLASLLVVHGLHPEDLETRVAAAIESVRPYLHSHGGDVEIVEVDAATGVVRLRAVGSCDGCPSSAVTLEKTVRSAVEAAAPEIARLEVDGLEPAAPVVPPAPVQLGRKPEVAVGAG
jgi:Fe-S cluster biogenesis protein NfuA